MKKVIALIRQWRLRRPLLEEERVVLNIVREKYPAHPKDSIFFIEEEKPLLPVRSSAMIEVWGDNGNGPWVHLTNLAGFVRDGMTLEELKETQI